MPRTTGAVRLGLLRLSPHAEGGATSSFCRYFQTDVFAITVLEEVGEQLLYTTSVQAEGTDDWRAASRLRALSGFVMIKFNTDVSQNENLGESREERNKRFPVLRRAGELLVESLALFDRIQDPTDVDRTFEYQTRLEWNYYFLDFSSPDASANNARKRAIFELGVVPPPNPLGFFQLGFGLFTTELTPGGFIAQGEGNHLVADKAELVAKIQITTVRMYVKGLRSFDVDSPERWFLVGATVLPNLFVFPHMYRWMDLDVVDAEWSPADWKTAFAKHVPGRDERLICESGAHVVDNTIMFGPTHVVCVLLSRRGDVDAVRAYMQKVSAFYANERDGVEREHPKHPKAYTLQHPGASGIHTIAQVLSYWTRWTGLNDEALALYRIMFGPTLEEQEQTWKKQDIAQYGFVGKRYKNHTPEPIYDDAKRNHFLAAPDDFERERFAAWHPPPGEDSSGDGKYDVIAMMILPFSAGSDTEVFVALGRPGDAATAAALHLERLPFLAYVRCFAHSALGRLAAAANGGRATDAAAESFAAALAEAARVRSHLLEMFVARDVLVTGGEPAHPARLAALGQAIAKLTCPAETYTAMLRAGGPTARPELDAAAAVAAVERVGG